MYFEYQQNIIYIYVHIIPYAAGFPKVLGYIDGTQVRIRTSVENEVDYVNRKSYHSLNVQVLNIAYIKST